MVGALLLEDLEEPFSLGTELIHHLCLVVYNLFEVLMRVSGAAKTERIGGMSLVQ